MNYISTNPAIAPTSDAWLRLNAERIIECYLVTVTPEIAGRWLAANNGNRPITRSHIRTIAADMVAGRWELTHQAIAFSIEGRLLDGQHRLMAIVETGVAVQMIVFAGVADKVFRSMDRGMKRSMRDHLQVSNRLTEPCNFLARLLLPGGLSVASPQEVQAVMDVFGDDLNEQLAAAGRSVKGRTTAGIRAAWTLRHYAANADGKALLKTQWAAFVHVDPPEMDSTTVAMFRRVENMGLSVGGAASANERTAVAWIGFNPKKRDLDKVIVRDTIATIDELRDVLRLAMGVANA